MAGSGSGRYREVAVRSTTDSLRAIDVRRLARDGMLRPGSSGTWRWIRSGVVVASLWTHAEPDRVVLMRRLCGRGTEWRHEHHPVRIERTRCNLGGSRPWFVCPIAGCGRRVAILYDNDRSYACRQCYRLAYPSTRENRGFRAIRRAERIRERLGWRPGVFYGSGGKPKGMRWNTFHRLTDQHDQLGSMAMCAVALRFGFADRLIAD